MINFKPDFLKDFHNEVVLDYKHSFIGAFAMQLFEHFLKDSECELLMSLTKFIGNTGFSLVHNTINLDAKRSQMLNCGFLPEFIPVQNIL